VSVDNVVQIYLRLYLKKGFRKQRLVAIRENRGHV